MSQQLMQHNFVTTLQSVAQSALQMAKRMPLSVWRGLVTFLIAAWIVHSAANLFWLLFPVPDVAQPQNFAAPLQTAARPKDGKNLSFDNLARLGDAFGKVTAGQVVKTTPTVTQPVDTQGPVVKTKLRLKLHGVFASSDPKKGSAIIADGNDQELYSVGDEIKNNRGVTLSGVHEKRVVLNNKGRLESLWLFSEEDFAISARRPEPKKQKKTARAAPSEIRRTARPDQIPKNIGDVVRFSVHREGGKMIGYRIRPGRDRDLFTQVGLKPNDIVTSVNGIEVNDPKQIRSVYKSMKTATEAHLTVLRDGTVHSITISLDSGA